MEELLSAIKIELKKAVRNNAKFVEEIDHLTDEQLLRVYKTFVITSKLGR